MKYRMRITAFLAALVLTAAMLPLSVSAGDYENTYQNTGNQPADLVGVAKTQVGYVEGENDYSKYGAYFDNANAPWCGYFVAWCAEQAGIPSAVIPRSGGAGSYYTAGTFHERTSGYLPQPGDLVLYGTYGDVDHVGIVERFDEAASRAYILDGNWSDQVSSHTASLSDTTVMGFVTPYYTSEVTELEAYNMVVPSAIPLGGSYSISGFLASPTVIESVSVVIADEEGAVCISQTAEPGTATYELSAMDADIRFGDLAPGYYTYTVTATDTETTKRWGYLFEVVGEITFTLSDTVFPSQLAAGATFSLYGTVACTEALQNVTVAVYDALGTYRTGASYAPSALRFELHTLDAYLAFDELTAGAHTLRVTARSAHDETQWDFPFTVGDVTKQEFALADAAVPTLLSLGEPCTLGGTVRSSETITALKATITAEDAVAQNVTVVSDDKEVSLSSLTELDFSALAEGTYTLKLEVIGANGTTAWYFDFEVKDHTVTFTLEDASFPTTLGVGGVFSVKGVLTASAVLTRVEVAVTDTGGTDVIKAQATLSTTTYDLSRLDARLAFDTLEEGSYIYVIRAYAGGAFKQWEYPFTVRGTAEGGITLSGASYPTAIEVGGVYPVKGTVKSNEPFETVEVRVTTKSGTVKIRATATPNTKTYDLAALDNDVAFNILAEGHYIYTIYAKTASYEEQWDYEFTVGNPETSIRLSGQTYPTAIDVGGVYPVKGTLTAATALTKAEVRVIDQEGNVKIRATATPNATTYNLALLDNDVTFSTLSQGFYTYTIYASTATEEAQWDYEFTVSKPTVTISLSGQTYPTAIAVGGVYPVKGIVSSAATLTKAEVRVTDQDGTVKIRATATPNATSYDLALLDNDVTFNTLAEGYYTYTIYAAAGTVERQWDYEFTVGDPAAMEPTLGDLNGDGKVNVVDAMRLFSGVSGRLTLTETEKSAADVNGDGNINVVDAMRLFSAVSGR